MTQKEWLIIIVCGVVLWMIASAILDWLKSRRERPLYRAVADSLSFTFSENASMESLPQKDSFLLLTGKDSKHVSNLLSGTLEGAEVRILDYTYSMHSGSQGRRRKKLQTLVMFRLHDSKWPDLMMMPDSFALKLPKALGMKDIDLADAPEFSRRYFLNGSDETAIRESFDGR